MHNISGLEFEKDADGKDAFVRIDLNMYSKDLEYFFIEVGAIESQQVEEFDFEKKWKEGLTLDQLRENLYGVIDSLQWIK